MSKVDPYEGWNEFGFGEPGKPLAIAEKAETVTVEASFAMPIVVLDRAVVERVAELNRRAVLFEVVDDENFTHADETLAAIAGLAKRIEKNRKAVKEPVLELGRTIDDACRTVADTLEESRRGLGELVSAYLRKKEQERREAEEAERLRLEAMRESVDVELEPDVETLDEARAAAIVEIEPEIVTTVPKSSVSLTKRKDLRIIDASKIPVTKNGFELMKPNTAAIKKLLLAGVEVPGCELVEVDGFAVRGRR